MNLFRSEEHARNWSQFDTAYKENLKPLSYWLDRFSTERFRARARPDYFSWRAKSPGSVPPDQLPPKTAR